MNSARKVAELASRLVPLVENNIDLLPVLDYAAGALLCLMEAEKYGFRDRIEPCDSDYQDKVVKAIKDMEAGNRPQADFWIADWHFNSALVRIVASYDRANGALKRKQRSQGGPPKTDIEQKRTTIARIRKEVNSLKHQPDANSEGRDVGLDEALAGLEELLTLVAKY